MKLKSWTIPEKAEFPTKEPRTIREKIATLKAVEKYRDEIDEILDEIISNTYDCHIDSVDKFTVGDTTIDVSYWYTCRGEHGGECVSIPIEWLDEGFDYKAAYLEECKRQERKARRAEARERKAQERKEYKVYLMLKEKFANKGVKK